MVGTLDHRFLEGAVGSLPTLDPGSEAFLPGPGDPRRQVERADSGVVVLQARPEVPGQGRGQVVQSAVIQLRPAFLQVIDQEPADRHAGHAVAVDELLAGELPGDPVQEAQGRRRVGRQMAQVAKPRVEEGPTRVVDLRLSQLDGVLDRVTSGDVDQASALGEHDARQGQTGTAASQRRPALRIDALLQARVALGVPRLDNRAQVGGPVAEQPRQRKPNHIRAGQYQQPGLYDRPLHLGCRAHPGVALMGPTVRTRGCRRCLPPLLPALAWETGQPGHDRVCSPSSGPPCVFLLRPERRQVQECDHLVRGRARRGPSRPGGSSRKPGLSLP